MSMGSQSPGGRTSAQGRLIIAIIVALFSLVSYFVASERNPVTGEKQRVAMSPQQEIALGLQAEPEMVAQHGGLAGDPRARAHVDEIGGQLLDALNETLEAQERQHPWKFKFHLLRDPKTINAFALPGGQVFITAALYEQLETDGQLAGVLGHEIGHVLSRHGAQRLAKQKLTQGLVGAAGVAGGDVDSARLAQAVGQLINLQYGRDDELDADKWGVRLMADAGYDPRSMLGVMKILDRASSGGGPPEFLSTHPKPANRAAYIEEVIQETFPKGVPQGLKP